MEQPERSNKKKRQYNAVEGVYLSELLRKQVPAFCIFSSDRNKQTTKQTPPKHKSKMPVPKRRRTSKALTISGLSEQLYKLMDLNVIFQKSKTLLLYGFTPLVVFVGLQIEPRPSLLDLFNIWE